MTLAVRRLFRVFSNSPEQNGRNTSYSRRTGERVREIERVLSPFHTLSPSRKPTWTEIKAAQKPLLKWLLLFFVVFIVVICDSYTADLLDKVRETREYRERGERERDERVKGTRRDRKRRESIGNEESSPLSRLFH